MKSLINLRAGILVLMLLLLSGISARADVDDFVLSVRNVTHSVNTIEFDLYLLDDDGDQTFEFAALQMGLLLNSSIYGTGTLTVSYDNSDSELDGDQQFVNFPDVVAPLAGYEGRTLIRLMPNNIPPVPPGAGSGTVISATGDGTFLARFTISSSQNFAPNSRAGLEFCSGEALSPLYPTVVYSYIDGTSTGLEVTPDVDAIVDGDPLLNPTLPAEFNVTGGGSYCEGGLGLPVGLDGSEADATYTLYRNGLAQPSPIPGTGVAITFGIQTEGNYTVTATNVAGDASMTGQAVITETPNNTITLTSGAGTDNQSVCINSPITTITYSTTGATGIGTASGLPEGVNATWADDIITISGTPTESETFTYMVPLDGGCGTVNATGAITVLALPTITVSTAPFCSVDLLTYSLEVTVSTGTVTSSSGTVLSLGGDLWSITGVAVGNDITVTVTDANTCDNTLSVSSPDCSCPVVAAPVSGGDESYCAGSAIPSLTVSVGDGETADWYDQDTGGELLLPGNTTYTPTTPGTYYAEARVTANNCVSSTRTSVTLTENPLPAVTLGTIPAVCIDLAPFNLTQGFPTGGTYSGTGITNGVTGQFDPSVAGVDSHTIIYTYTDVTTGCTGSATNSITVNGIPTITVSTAPFCSVDLLTYSLEVTVSAGTVTSSSGTVLSLGGDLWSITDVPVGNDITVTVTDANTCDNTLSVSSPDCSCPVVAAPVSGGDESYCAGSAIPSLTVSVGDVETADWYDQDTGGELLLPGNTTYTPTTPGTYYAEARVTANNCVSSTRTSVTLTENPLPTAITGLTEINVGSTTVLSSTPTGGIWSSSNEAIAVIDPGTGEVTGNSAGSTVVTYTLPTGCFVSTIVNVSLNEFTKSLPIGWSWFSTNVVSADMSLASVLSGCAADGNYIKDQFTSATYFDGFGWFGYLTSIDPSRMYKINTTNSCTINFAGTPVEVSNSIDLVTGWNWIGFLPQNELDINSALSSLSLTELDYIKNQVNSATYFEGFGWFGYLTEMVPGEGYMIRLANPGTLIYPDMPANKSASVKKGLSPEEFNPSDFEYNASVSAGVLENFQFKVSEGDILIAYVNGQIRGIVPGLEFEPTGNYVFPIMVHSNREGEMIEFKYLNAVEDKLYDCIEKIEFKSDMVLGDAINPFKLNVSLKSNDDGPETDIGVKLSCYPNPFTGMVNIEYFVPFKSVVRLTIYDSYGWVIEQSVNQTEEPGYKLTQWVSSGQADGIYIIHLQIGEKVSVKKLTLIR